MSWYRRSSAVERLEWSRRRSSVVPGIPLARRSNSKGFNDMESELAPPPTEQLCHLLELDQNYTFEPTVIPPPTSADETERRHLFEESVLETVHDGNISRSSSSNEINREVTAERNCITMEKTEIFQLLENPDCFRNMAISEVAAGKFLSEEIAPQCLAMCRGHKALIIEEIDYKPVFKFSLESFTEKRELCWSFEPYTGKVLDDRSKGVMPNPWSINCHTPKYFQNNVVTIDMPHTDCLCTCCSCGGMGRKRCTACNALGWEKCSFCLGDGTKVSIHGYKDRCHLCFGSGRKKCIRCNGDGMASCCGCGGTGQIRCFLNLIITWCSHITEKILTKFSTELPSNIHLGRGNTIFKEEAPEASIDWEHSNYDFQETVCAIFKSHKKEYLQMEKLLRQCQRLEVVPINKVSYQEGHGKSAKCAFIHGTDNNVYITDKNESFCCFM